MKKYNKIVKGSIHQYNISETSKYVVKDGVSEYKVLISENASEKMKANVEEFVNLFKEATNIELMVVTDGNDFDENDKCISIGQNKLFLSLNVLMDYKKIKSQGFIIKTINNTIFLSGYTDQACLNAMYQYLNLVAKYLFLGPETYILNTGLKDIKLFDYDIVDVPDIEYRISSYGFVDALSNKRYRFISHADHVIPVYGNHYHNTFNYFNPDIYKKDHPEWYSLDDTQLCYTARGNEESLKEMHNHVFEVMKEHLIKYPNNNAISFTIQDRNTFCNCKACNDSFNKYNASNAAVVIKFLNVISDMINEWFEGEGKEYKRDFKILFFAYLSTNKAPTSHNKLEDKYSPIDETVICRDNVCPFFADVRGDYTTSYYDEESANVEFARSVKAWKSCSSNLYFWNYSTNFNHYLTPYNSFDAMADTYKFVVKHNALYLFEQAQFNQGVSSTGWSYVKQYLTSRLSWDCNIKTEQVYDEFFSEFYSKEAGDVMRKLFDEYLSLANYQTDVLGYNGSCSIYHNPFQEKYWNKDTLINWINRFDDALQAIENYKQTDANKYEKYSKHIRVERVQYVYLLVKIYESSLSEKELIKYKKLYHDDVELTQLLYENELRKVRASELLR